jgi:ectoine hydroxylase-related dioxygenase (phytanoyl-CoA dioxygenase family)
MHLCHGQETLEVLSRILVGPEDYDYHFYMGELRISGAGPSIYPPDADGAGYTYWHRDHPQPHRWPISRSRDVKMFVNVFDVPENGGPLSVVPGSHRLPFNPWEIFGKSFKSSLTLDADLDQTDMPNHVKFAAPAGCALIFDVRDRNASSRSRAHCA